MSILSKKLYLIYPGDRGSVRQEKREIKDALVRLIANLTSIIENFPYRLIFVLDKSRQKDYIPEKNLSKPSKFG